MGRTKATIELNIRSAVRQYDDIQKVRISIGNRLKKKSDRNGGGDQKIPEAQKETWIIPDAQRAVLQAQYDMMLKMEEDTLKDITTFVKSHPLYTRYLSNIRGVGPIIAAVIIASYDIQNTRYVTSMWTWAGFCPGRDKPRKGEKICYNMFLKKKLMGVLATYFIQFNTVYADYYYNYKKRWEGKMIQEYDAEGEVTGEHLVTNGHRDMASRRYMMKAFLRDLYYAWKYIEGLEAFVPYEEKYKGIVHSGEKITDFTMFLDKEKEERRESRKDMEAAS